MFKKLFIYVAVSISLVAPLAIVPAHAATAKIRVLMVGDSLSWEARSPFAFTTTLGGKAEVQEDVFGGSALCDWLPTLKTSISTWHPQAVNFEFVGNSFTTCMKNAATGMQFTGAPLVSKYVTDAATAINLLRPTGAQVWFNSVPPMRDATLNTTAMNLNSAYAKLAAANSSFVHYTAAGNVVQWYQTPGRYVEYLPCLKYEPCQTPPFIRVRALDGIHFCPVNKTSVNGVISDCPVWSSGAWRYGAAMSAPIISWFHL